MGEMKAVQVLDQGYLEHVESWGSDQRIVEAARMSTNKGFLGWGPIYTCKTCKCKWLKHDGGTWSVVPDQVIAPGTCCDNAPMNSNIEALPGDEKLLKFLWDNRHATPFEMAGMTIEVKAPIFVFREWHRHRTQSYNEMSARYTPLPDENYMPSLERCKGDPTTTNKQAQGVAALAPDVDLLAWLARLADAYDLSQKVYEEGLALGIPKEIARCPVPVARYSRMMASTDLRNWLGFLTLRMAPGAQYEIRMFANAVGDIIAKEFPRTWELFSSKK